jgi:protein-S-isoprenylcysteine O-methyltransferase Ste14
VDKTRAAAGTFLFLFPAPGVVAGVVPWLLTGGEMDESWWLAVSVAGAILVLAGVVVLLNAFARFVLKGIGTPAPVAPTEKLVVGGLVAGFVRWYEEPTLRRQFGQEYEACTREVPGWWPRFRPSAPPAPPPAGRSEPSS